MQYALELGGVTKTFGDFWGRPRVRALADVDLAVERGSVTALLGRNGAGKSTLLHLCLGLLEPTGGRIAVLGSPPRDRALRRRIGYVPEESALHGFLTARETLLLHAGLCGLPRDRAHARAAYLLELVELSGDADRPAAEFSKGMARRLCLAQALVGDPEFLFLDEPTSGLDPLGVRLVKDLLVKLKSLGRTVFLSSHRLGEVEEVADAIAILEGGRVLLAGRTEEILGAPGENRRSLEAIFLATIAEGRCPCVPPSRS